MQVPFVNLGIQFSELENELIEAFSKIGKSGTYVLGEYLKSFEEKNLYLL